MHFIKNFIKRIFNIEFVSFRDLHMLHIGQNLFDVKIDIENAHEILYL